MAVCGGTDSQPAASLSYCVPYRVNREPSEAKDTLKPQTSVALRKLIARCCGSTLRIALPAVVTVWRWMVDYTIIASEVGGEKTVEAAGCSDNAPALWVLAC